MAKAKAMAMATAERSSWIMMRSVVHPQPEGRPLCMRRSARLN